ncbi:hypothetical protein GUJ93_ZPchr0004g39737 [Zizania palustris]|uniref:Uncharacterized protein n=1 Tax=Zizania palustris TaxID=103762 RepID=A0A8J5VYV7_ZIZPA|nr:hypothetical protein GUJ93_ZPchr0004g39737 [Zizania palustris]
MGPLEWIAANSSHGIRARVSSSSPPPDPAAGEPSPRLLPPPRARSRRRAPAPTVRLPGREVAPPRACPPARARPYLRLQVRQSGRSPLLALCS